MAVDQDLTVVGVPDRKAWVFILMGETRRLPPAAGTASPKGVGKGLGVHASVPLLAFLSEPWCPSWRDHSSRMVKKPVMFSAISRASSLVRWCRSRGCQTAMVCSVSYCLVIRIGGCRELHPHRCRDSSCPPPRIHTDGERHSIQKEEHRKARERKRRAECAPGRTQDERGPPKAMAVA